jgi:hypothetical protein
MSETPKPFKINDELRAQILGWDSQIGQVQRDLLYRAIDGGFPNARAFTDMAETLEAVAQRMRRYAGER